ncbi:MAG: phage tail protein [Moraxellaceae bacterium]|nr:phage tail protein [Moraxellaceae bacterium]
MMMSLGMYVFSLSTAAYQEFQQQIGWRHPSTGRVGVRPARQFLGPDDETITLNGTLMPEVTGPDMTLDELRKMGDAGLSYALIEGTGRVFGEFIIESMSITRTLFFRDGAARRIEFALTLKRDDDKIGLVTAPRGRLR